MCGEATTPQSLKPDEVASMRQFYEQVMGYFPGVIHQDHGVPQIGKKIS